jgi:hypothetical protein
VIELRGMIIKWIRANSASGHWLLHVYYHLIGHGASPDDAIKALELFVDDAVAMKERQGELKELL